MLVLEPETTALLIVDLQYGILALPLIPYDSAHVVERCVALGRTIAAAGGLLVAIHVDYSDGYADRPGQPVDAPLILPPGGLPQDWATLVPEIEALPAGVRITKRQQSAFYGTELDLQLRRRGIATVVIFGVATNFGVEGTARDAFNHNYAVVVAADACSSTAPTLHDFAVTSILPRFARVRGSAEILAGLSAHGAA